jgi:NADPH:quinone reductase-like Zn-dependent oxidoreductase
MGIALPNTMRSAVIDAFGPPESIRIASGPLPVPARGEVLVRVAYAAVNPIDCKTRAGEGIPAETFPLPLGWDVCGVVVRTGPEVSQLDEGDEVFGMARFPAHAGCYAEFVSVPADQLARRRRL